MAALRSRRLDAILGVSLDAAEYRHIEALVSAQVSESFDLDFKAGLYGSAEKGKKDLAADVAALANSAGGLLILGIAEDKQARAAAAPGVPISDDEIRRIHQITASHVAPLPIFDVLPVGNPAEPGHGFLVIAVPASPRAPHAVAVNDGLRFPVRHGTTTRYLSEPEVATAYRERFSRAHGTAERAAMIEANAAWRMKRADDHCWLLVSLVPDILGDLLIDHAALEAAQRAVNDSRFPMIIRSNFSWYRVDVGWRCVMLSGSPDSPRLARWLVADLHSDGAGIFAVNTIDNTRRGMSGPEDPASVGVHDEEIVNGLLSGLRFLARHARDRAGAGGDALIRAQIHGEDLSRTVLLSTGNRAFGDSMGRPLAVPAHEAQSAAPLDVLADDGPGLVAAAWLLASDLFQEFGLPEALQVTRDGELRRKYWSSYRHQEIQAWADQAGIPVTDETLPVP